MKIRDIKKTCKILLMFAVVIIAMAFVKVPVNADTGKTVRVSSAKQLKAAMKNSEVGTIIFRTEINANVTIKAVTGSEEKFLIIDAPNVSFTNKALFAEINIMAVNGYTENVSGNRIRLNSEFDGTITVGKKKQLDTLIVSSLDYFYPKYTLRKGAKLKNYMFCDSKWGEPIEGGCNMTEKQISLKYMNPCDCYESYTIKFNKNGRMISSVCKSDGAEFAHEYFYSYDSNGNLTRITGWDNENGEFTAAYTYSGNKLEKYSFESTFDITDEKVYSYNDEGTLVREEYNGYDSMDGQHFYKTGIVEYDDKGRMIYLRKDDLEYGHFVEYSYTYNSKGFVTEFYRNSSGYEEHYTYKYNKSGDKIKTVLKSEGTTKTYKYKYNELGEVID